MPCFSKLMVARAKDIEEKGLSLVIPGGKGFSSFFGDLCVDFILLKNPLPVEHIKPTVEGKSPEFSYEVRTSGEDDSVGVLSPNLITADGLVLPTKPTSNQVNIQFSKNEEAYINIKPLLAPELLEDTLISVALRGKIN